MVKENQVNQVIETMLNHKSVREYTDQEPSEKVFPLVQLVMGYPAEDKPPRPRYPIDFVLFEDEYPELDDEKISKAMEVMDAGYLAQNYYKDLNAKIPIKADDREDKYTFEDYSWTEHISRKWGQRHSDVERILEQLKKCGFEIE